MKQDNADQWKELKTISNKILQVLNKAQVQFDERNQNFESGYIQDLRQYCKIVTLCEEQLTLNLVEYELSFLGNIIKNISGFHLLILSNLLNWVQKFEFYLVPKEKSTPFEQLLDQSMKHKNKFIKFQESQASSQMNELNDSIQSLLSSNKIVIDSFKDVAPDNNGLDIVQDETEKMRENLKYNSKANTKIIIQKLLNKQKNNTQKIDQSTQTIMNGPQIQQSSQQNIELRELIEQTRFQYEEKVKEYKVKYQEAKLLLNAQKCEIEHNLALIESKNLIIIKLQQNRSNSISSPPQKYFIQKSTFEEQNKRNSVQIMDKKKLKLQPELLFQNIKLRSSSLPRIVHNSESMMHKSFSKLSFQISRNLISTQDVLELFKKFTNNSEFKAQFMQACKECGQELPETIENDKEDKNNLELKIRAFSKLVVILKEKHQFCGTKCEHINFLY